MAELIRLGAYRTGTDPAIDEAIHFHAGLDNFLAQKKSEHTDIKQSYSMLAEVLGMPDPALPPQPAAPAPASQATPQPGPQEAQPQQPPQQPQPPQGASMEQVMPAPQEQPQLVGQPTPQPIQEQNPEKND